MTKTVRIIGVPMDLGQQRRGVDMGPSALRYAGLQAAIRRLGHKVIDQGNLPVPVAEEMKLDPDVNLIQAVAGVCQAIFDAGRRCVAQEEFPLFLGGDHSISIGTVSAVSATEPVGLIWIDAHSDFNTPETSPSGNIHGMPVAVLTGDGPPELVNIGVPGAAISANRIVQIGIRDVDPEERTRLRQSGMHIFTMRDVDEHGMASVARLALERLGDLPRIHVSLDMDALDPDIAPGVGTPVAGGLTYREAHLLMEILGESGRVGSMDIVEINTILDDRNRTAELAVGLAASLMGQRIL